MHFNSKIIILMRTLCTNKSILLKFLVSVRQEKGHFKF